MEPILLYLLVFYSSVFAFNLFLIARITIPELKETVSKFREKGIPFWKIFRLKPYDPFPERKITLSDTVKRVGLFSVAVFSFTGMFGSVWSIFYGYPSSYKIIFHSILMLIVVFPLALVPIAIRYLAKKYGEPL